MAERGGVEQLRRELAEVDRGPGRRYPADARRRAISWITARRAQGASLETIAQELGLARNTVQQWGVRGKDDGEQSAAPTAALVPVKVTAPTRRETLALVSPAGFRVEGLSLEEAAQMLRALG